MDRVAIERRIVKGKEFAGAPCAVVYELDVDPALCDAIVLRALEDTKHLGERVPGFIEARVLASDDKRRITIYAAWQTRHDWSASQWDPIIGTTLGDLHAMAGAVRFKFYSRREVISGPILQEHGRAADELSALLSPTFELGIDSGPTTMMLSAATRSQLIERNKPVLTTIKPAIEFVGNMARAHAPAFKPVNGRAAGWVTFAGLAIVHLGALCVFIPGTFHWSALFVMFALYYATGAWGISLGYHRLLTHRSFKVRKTIEYIASLFGVLALQGGPIVWVSTHRAHHAHTDKTGDPHDVHRGLLWSHFEWLYRPNDARPSPEEQLRLTPDLAGEAFYRFLEKTYGLWTIALAVLLFSLGGWSWVIWGIFVRIVLTYHITWLVNSAAHHSGYRTFNTGDESTNNWWVALLGWGEGWHNNHHAFPSSARHGLRWFEFDSTWWTVKMLAWLKIASGFRLPTPAMLERLKLRSPQTNGL